MSCIGSRHSPPCNVCSTCCGKLGWGKYGSKAALNVKRATLLSSVPPAPEPHGFPGVRKGTALQSSSSLGDSCCPVMPTADLAHHKERFPWSQGWPRDGAGQNGRRRSQRSVSTPSPTPTSFLQCASLHIGAGTEGRQLVPENKSGADYFPAGAMRKP